MGRDKPAPDASAFAALLAEARAKVDAELAAVFDARLPEASAHGPDTEALLASVKSLALRGGKRFRAALVAAAHRACGGEGFPPYVVSAGVAIELLQTYFLIHDDWMDGDLVRRGGPSVHAILRGHFGDSALGDASAILAGDLASAMATEALASADVDPALRASAVILFARMQKDVIYGQQLDLAARPESVEAMHALKTGSYTVRGPVLLGAVLARGSDAAKAALERWAKPLGVAFQLRDDLLGAFGDAAETGKPFGSDLRAGKRTALVVEAEKRISDRARLDAVLGVRDASDEAVRAAVAELAACGARDAVEGRLAALVDEAIAAARDPSLGAEGRTLLAGAAQALTGRRS